MIELKRIKVQKPGPGVYEVMTSDNGNWPEWVPKELEFQKSVDWLIVRLNQYYRKKYPDCNVNLDYREAIR